MAITYVKGVAGSHPTGFPYTTSSPWAKAFPANVTAGNTILVAIFLAGATPSASCTDSQGNAYTQCFSYRLSDDNKTLLLFAATAKTTGSCTVTTTSSSTSYAQFYMEWSGISTPTLDTFSTQYTSSSFGPFPAASITLASAGELVLEFVTPTNATTAASFNNPVLVNTGVGDAFYYSVPSSAGSYTAPTLTGSSSTDGQGAYVWAIALKPAASGTNYTKAVTETLALGESFTANTTRPRSLSDALTLGDSVTTSAARGRSFADTFSLGDVFTRSGSFLRSLADLFSFGDSFSGGILRSYSLADSITLGDSTSRSITRGRTLTDALSFSDTLTRRGSFRRSLADALILSTDSVSSTYVSFATPKFVQGKSLITTTSPYDAALPLSQGFTSSVTAGNTIIVLIQTQAPVDSPNNLVFSDNQGNTYVDVTSPANHASGYNIFAATAKTTSSCTVTISAGSGGNPYYSVFFTEWFGLSHNLTDLVDAVSTLTADSSSPYISNAVTTTNPYDLVLSLFDVSGSVTAHFTASTGTACITNNAGGMLQAQVQATPGTVTPIATGTSNLGPTMYTLALKPFTYVTTGNYIRWALAETYSLVESLARVAGRSLSDNTPFTERLAKSPSKTLMETGIYGNFWDWASRRGGKNTLDTYALTDSTNLGSSVHYADSVPPADSLARTPGKTVSDSFDLSDTIAWLQAKMIELLDSISLSDTISWIHGFTLLLLDSIGLLDVANRAASRAYADAMAVSDVATKAASRAWADTLNLADTVSNYTRKVWTETTTLVESIARGTQRTFTGTISLAESLAKKALPQSLVDALPLGDTLVNGARKAWAETVSIADNISRSTQRIFTGALSLAETIAKKASPSAFSDALNLSDTYAAIKKRVLSLIDSIIPTDRLTKTAGRVMTDGVALAESLGRKTARLLAEVIALTSVINFSRVVMLSDSIPLIDKLLKSTQRTIAELISLSDQAARTAGRTLVEAAITVVDALSRNVSWALGLLDSIPPVDELVKSARRTMADSITVSEHLVRSVARTLATEVIALSDVFAWGWRRFLSLSDRLDISDIADLYRSRTLIALRRYVAEIWQRLWQADTPQRLWQADNMQRSWAANEELMITTNKDPLSAENFQIDWTDALQGDPIVSSTWIVPDGITADDETSNNTSSTVRLSGGALGARYQVTNEVTLASGQVKVQRLVVTISPNAR